MANPPLPVLNRVVRPGRRKHTAIHPKAENLSRTEIDFVVNRIVDKHSAQMKQELKTVLGVLIGDTNPSP